MPYRWAKPGTVNEARCNLCGATCTIERNRVGPTSWAAAMGRINTHHDAIRCPHEGTDWHLRAEEIRFAMSQMPSPRVRALMEQDLAELLSAYAKE